MLVELGLVEQRLKAVHEVLEGASVVDVAERYGVVRQTVHTWLKNYSSDGLAGLVDRSSRPEGCLPWVTDQRTTHRLCRLWAASSSQRVNVLRGSARQRCTLQLAHCSQREMAEWPMTDEVRDSCDATADPYTKLAPASTPPPPEWNIDTGTEPEHGYRVLTFPRGLVKRRVLGRLSRASAATS